MRDMQPAKWGHSEIIFVTFSELGHFFVQSGAF